MSDEDNNRRLEGTETREEIEQVKKSTSQSEANSSYNEVVLNVQEENLSTKLGKLQQEPYPTERERERQKNEVEIKKIPEIMKRNKEFEKYFTPELTFGPIHCHDYLKREIKDELSEQFISVKGSTQGDIFEDFKTNMDGIRACFGEDIISDIGDEELMGLLFLDGCAMLGFIHCYVNWRLKEVGISDVKAADIERDLLLLENQIPFRVLEVLIDSGKDHKAKKRLKDSLVTFIILMCRGTFPGHSPQGLRRHLEKYCFPPEKNKDQKVVHLLDVFREALLFDTPSFDLFGFLLTVIRGAFWILCSCGCLAISYFLGGFKPDPDYNIISLFRTAKGHFYSVQELKAAGITFKPSHSLNVSFRSLFFFRPQLMLPTLIVDNLMASKLVNLVAYEWYLPESHPNGRHWVTSYVNLLDSLVDNEQDIKDLRAAGILRNTLSTDEGAAKLINEVGTGCLAPNEDAYEDVKGKIGKYYRTKCAVWLAEVCSTHFSSPWTIIALFAATVVLLLTAIQTWYAVNPKK